MNAGQIRCSRRPQNALNVPRVTLPCANLWLRNPYRVCDKDRGVTAAVALPGVGYDYDKTQGNPTSNSAHERAVWQMAGRRYSTLLKITALNLNALVRRSLPQTTPRCASHTQFHGNHLVHSQRLKNTNSTGIGPNRHSPSRKPRSTRCDVRPRVLKPTALHLKHSLQGQGCESGRLAARLLQSGKAGRPHPPRRSSPLQRASACASD